MAPETLRIGADERLLGGDEHDVEFLRHLLLPLGDKGSGGQDENILDHPPQQVLFH